MTARRDDREEGAIAPLMGLMLAALCGFAGLAVDLGLVQYERRALQASVDAAALSAARAPANAQSIATTVLSRNGRTTGTPSITTWIYRDDPSLTAAQRLSSAASATPNAVRVDARREVSLGLTRVLGGPATLMVGATAIAAHQPGASFTIGSGLARIGGPLDSNPNSINQTLSRLLGANPPIALNAVSYRGLANSSIQLFKSSDILASQLGLAAGTYDQLLNSTVSVSQLLNVAASAIGQDGDPSAATSLSILSQSTSAGRSLRVGDLIRLGLHDARHIGDFGADASYTTLGINALDLATAAATLGGANAGALQSTLPVSVLGVGLVNLSTTLTIVEPPQSPPAAFVSPTVMPVSRRTASTAQVRLVSTASLLGLVNLTIQVNAAPATATLESVSCDGVPRDDTVAVIAGSTGIASVSIQVAGTGLLNGVINVSVSSDPLGPSYLPEADRSFSMTDITNGTPHIIGSSNVLSSTIQNLRTGIDAKLLGLDLSFVLKPVLQTVLAPVSALLSAIAADKLLDGILASAGVQVGYAEIRATGVRCGAAALVL